MALGANSYGSVAGVASFTPRYSNGAGTFDEGTTPTISEVEGWIDQVSGIVNVLLTNEGQTVPQTNAAIVEMIDFFINQEVAALVEGSHNAGRFGPTAKNPRAGRYDLIFEDAAKLLDRIVTKGLLSDWAASTAVSREDGFSE